MNFKDKIKDLKPYDLNCNVFDVYNYNGLSMQELLCQFFHKINDCIKISNETIDLASWLVNEGLSMEVVNKLMLWLEDGTLEDIINVNIFNSLNTKIDNLNSQLEHNTIHTSGYINVKDFGAKGDGVTDDYEAIQNAINHAYNDGIYKIIIPSGWYYLSHALETRNDTHWDVNGLLIDGAGFNTVLSRYPKNNLPSLDDISTDDEMSNLSKNSIIAIYSTKNIISNLKLYYSKVGIYLGQDYKNTSKASYTLFNKFDNIFIQHCGTGIVSRAGQGSYYNNFKNIQIAEGTIGIDVRYPYIGFDEVFNRNNFTDCEINKVYCGVALWNGDTNVFNGVHFEGVGIGHGTKPTWLPNNKPVAIYPKYQLNTFAFCKCEGNTLDVYDDTNGTNYICNHFDMYNGKFVKSDTSQLGTIIGSGTGGTADYFKMGGIIYQPTKVINAEYPEWQTVFTHEACDKDYNLKNYSVLDNLNPKPLKQYNDGILKHKKVCGINYLWLKTSILVSTENKNKDIDLILPCNVSEDLHLHSYRAGLLFNLFLNGTHAKGRFVANNKFRIYKPSNGWCDNDVAGEYTDIDLHLTYY